MQERDHGNGAAKRHRLALRWLPVMLVVVVFGVFGLLLWEGWRQVGDAGPPIVRATETYKRPPTPEEQPQDEALNARSPFVNDLDDPEPRGLERLLPPPEEPPRSAAAVLEPPGVVPPPPEPAAPPAAPAATPEPSPAPVLETLEAAEVEDLPPLPDVDALLAEGGLGEAAIPPNPLLEAAEGRPADLDDRLAAPAPLRGGWRLQLVALLDEAAAWSSWDGFRRRFPQVLGALDAEVEAGSSKGIPIFRLRAGPFVDRASAEAACARLKAQGGDCFVVGP